MLVFDLQYSSQTREIRDLEDCVKWETVPWLLEANLLSN